MQNRRLSLVKNIAYQTDRLARYFGQNRIAWQQFYESERAIIEQLALSRDTEILDVGCGCGGLGLALRERLDRKSTRLNSSHIQKSRMPSSA